MGKNELFTFLNPSETEHGINKGSSSEYTYKQNFYKIYATLESKLKNEKIVITHNPWG